MKTEIISFRQIIRVGVYVLLIFSLLALIRTQSRNLVSNVVSDTSANG